MQHHPLIGEYTLERNELKRLRKSANFALFVSMCRQVVRLASRDAFSCPTAPEPVLCLGGTQSSAFGQLSGLFYLNIPKCVKHKEDDNSRVRAPLRLRYGIGFVAPACRTVRVHGSTEKTPTRLA